MVLKLKLSLWTLAGTRHWRFSYALRINYEVDVDLKQTQTPLYFVLYTEKTFQ